MNNHEIFFSIYPNTRGFGYACMESPTELIDCGVVTVKPLSNSKTVKRMKDLILYFEPTILIVRYYDTKFSQKSKRISRLIRTMVSFGKQQKLKVHQYSREQIKDVFDQFGAKNKYQIAQKIIEGIPQLKSRSPKFRKPWMSEDYHMGVFDAVAMILTHYYLND